MDFSSIFLLSRPRKSTIPARILVGFLLILISVSLAAQPPASGSQTAEKPVTPKLELPSKDIPGGQPSSPPPDPSGDEGGATIGATNPKEAIPVPDPMYGQPYIVTKGDTCASICQRFMGDPNLCDELVAYNKGVAAKKLIVVGREILVPGAYRTRMARLVERADTRLKEARELKADVFGKDSYDRAAGAFASAQQMMKEAKYDHAGARARLAVAYAGMAIQQAADNSLQQMPLLVTKVYGDCSYSTDPDNQEFFPLLKGNLPSPCTLKTGPYSRIELTLPDGSRCVLAEETVVRVDRLIQDQRTRKQDNKLQINAGDCLFTFSDNPARSGILDISGLILIEGANATVRAKRTRDGRLFLCSYDKEVVFRDGDQEIRVPGGQGIAVQKGKFVQRAHLVAPPRESEPRNNAVLAQQRPVFSWRSTNPSRVSKYRLEIAAEPTFVEIIQVLSALKEHRKLDDFLPEGIYYWRLSLIDKDGFESAFTSTRQFTIKKNYAVEFQLPPKTPSRRPGHYLVSPEEKIFARAAPNSSVEALEYRIGGDGAFLPLRKPFTLGGSSQEIDVYIRGICMEGKRGPPAIGKFQVDASFPDLAAQLSWRQNSPGGISTLTVELSANDDSGVQGIEFRTAPENANTPFQPYSSPVKFTDDVPAELHFRATDKLGNVSPVRRVLLSTGSKSQRPAPSPLPE